MPIREQVIDWWGRQSRERWRAFARFLWQRFLDDRCFETAGALAYTTVFALVPLTAVAFGVLSVSPVFEQWTGQLGDFVFTHFVPEAARAVEDYLLRFAEGASRLTLAGVLALIVSAALVLAGIESTFNRIWRVETARPPLTRLLVYWAALTLGVLLAVAGLAFTSYLYAGSLGAAAVPQPVDRLLRAVPVGIELVVFTLAYMVIPNRTVAFRHGLAGGALATALFEAAKYAFALYLRSVPSYQVLYGALAAIPIFLLWVYLSWVVVLLGASFAASLSAFRFQPVAMRLPAGYELFGLLRLLGRFRQAHRRGAVLDSDTLHRLEPSLTDDLMQRMLGDLARAGIVRRAEGGGWLLARDLDQVPLAELYETARLRIPVAEARLPCRDDPLGCAAAAALDELRLPLRAELKRPVGSLLRDIEDDHP
ncbi:YihY family inner membrane protein [Rehaibacterium terrae]|jgi:membrane protein|uniref:UPF0761 membrane protein HNQ58_002481 n=1 Tax=Rehaibacterium terrae TaxID=1341696 RepID=A0A7W7Y1U4_9GAMM|nr:YihY family inner membrane protein [Rehaibacterium terrae]MBB5016566.1 membrane protein [Rehaibacterium terrae]